MALFAQDEWRARDELTVTAGLRYDIQDLEDPIQTDWNNVSPRAGIAWAPGSRRTVVRGSAGLYFDRIPLRAVSNALQRDGVKYRVAARCRSDSRRLPSSRRSSPNTPAGLLTAISTIDPEIESGIGRQASVQVEHKFVDMLSATAAYLALRGSRIIMSRNVNAPTLSAVDAARLGVPNLGRPNPAFGNIGRFESIGRSRYDGLTLSVNTRGQRWGDVRAAYTLSRALDDAGNAFFSSPQDSNDMRADWGPSDNDQRHRLTLSGIVDPGRALGADGVVARNWALSWNRHSLLWRGCRVILRRRRLAGIDEVR